MYYIIIWTIQAIPRYRVYRLYDILDATIGIQKVRGDLFGHLSIIKLIVIWQYLWQHCSAWDSLADISFLKHQASGFNSWWSKLYTHQLKVSKYWCGSVVGGVGPLPTYGPIVHLVCHWCGCLLIILTPTNWNMRLLNSTHSKGWWLIVFRAVGRPGVASLFHLGSY